MTKEQKQFYYLEIFKELHEIMKGLDREISRYFIWFIDYDIESSYPRIELELTPRDKDYSITFEPALPDICYVNINNGCCFSTEEMSIINEIFLKCRLIAAHAYENYEKERGWI